MGNDEAVKPSKSDKASSPAVEQTNIHAYPDWATMQAYYGPGVALPPFFNSAVTSGHAPHPYIWPPQHMMTPYGTPYAALYPHGGVYAHPAVPLVATPLSVETPAKSSGNTDRGLMKKLKGFDGLTVSIGNGTAESAGEEAAHGLSQSAECGAEGSSDGSDGNTAGVEQTRRKGSSKRTPSTGNDGDVNMKASHISGVDANGTSDRALGVTVPPGSFAGKSVGTVPSAGVMTALELRSSQCVKAEISSSSVPPTPGAISSEVWIQDERELKRERRKQSNRESARRSRLRKQAETEELAMKVESLNAENIALRSEINRLTENSDKLRLENAALMEKLKDAQLRQEEGIDSGKMEEAPSASTENLLAKVDNHDTVHESMEMEPEYETYENNSKSGAKLHQLLESNPRADAVAAS